MLTDSGGVQEETTYLGVPCLTVRPNTERPVTITSGTNQLVSNDRESLRSAIRDRLTNDRRTGKSPDLWDGRAAQRILQILLDFSP